MSISIRNFGKTKSGEEALLFRITNSQGAYAEVTNFGAILVALSVPDRDGNFADVVTGFDDVRGYFKNPSFFGSTIGRNANRIAGCKFSINGKTYELENNDKGNNLHSNFDECFNKRTFTYKTSKADNSVKFSIVSPDGDQGFPGNLDASVTYRLTEDNALEIEYKAMCDADTVYNPTNHSYFNLSGHASGTAMNHKLWLNCSRFTPTVKGSIPTGELLSVEGTPFDFTVPHVIGERINEKDKQLRIGGGYDHNFVIDNVTGKPEKIAVLSDDVSGRVMTVYTDLPGVQFYAGNFIKTQKGKEGAEYTKRCAVCLETQYFPNAINEPGFAAPLLKAGQTFKSITRYAFSVQ